MNFKKCLMLYNISINPNEDCIYYYLNYYKWNDVKDLPINDLKYRNHNLIYEFKNGRYFYTNPLTYFKKCINNSLTMNDEWHVCVIPNHNQVGNNHSNNITKLLDYCNLKSNFIREYDTIIRTRETTAKHNVAEYGSRDFNKDLETLIINPKKQVQGKNYIVFDDVATSGASMKAAEILLKGAGANKVVCIVLGKTMGDEYYGQF